MRKFQFEENQICHIYNRGVDKRDIFLDDKDYLRFIHYLFELNNGKKISNIGYRINQNQSIEVEPQYLERRMSRELLVEILAFVLMPNHYHLLLRQKKENGIVKFMQKLGTGHTMCFNNKHDRAGSLFQGRFKASLVNEDSYFTHIPNYIHLNPLKLLKKYGGSTSIGYKEKMEFLKKYRWSSFPDYAGEKNFPSVTSREFLLNNFGGEIGYKKNIEDIVKEDSVEKIDLKSILS